MQEVQSTQHHGLVDAFNRDEARPLGTEAEVHGIVVLAEGLQAGNGRIRVDLDAKHSDLIDLLLQQVGRKAIGRNAVAQLPAGVL